MGAVVKTEIGIPVKGGGAWSPLLNFQREYIQSTKRIKVAQWGRGCGKSSTILLDTLYSCLEWEMVRWLYLAPSYKILTDGLYPILDDIDQTYRELYGHSLIRKFTRSTQTNKLTLINGSQITFRSGARIDDLRGGSYGGVSIEEAGYVSGSPASWAAFVPCIRSVGPHEILCGGTPGGEGGVLAVLLAHAQAHPEECLVSRAYTYQNPHFSKEQLTLLQNTLSRELWEQEIEGMVIGRTGLVYPEFSREKHIIPFNPAKDMGVGTELFGVIDWGFAQAHGQLFAVSRLPDGRPKVVLLWEHPFDRTDELLIVKTILEQSKRYPVRLRALITDPEGRSGNVTAIRFMANSGIPVVFETNPARRRIVDTLELVRRGLSNAAGSACYFISQDCAKLPCNGPGGKGSIPSFEAYVLGHVDRSAGVLSNRPFDDNVHTHSMDGWRYLLICLARFGYTWPATIVDVQPRKLN